MPKIRVNGVELFYEEKGHGEETIVFSHGLLFSHKMFAYQMEFLSARFRVISYDHRGQGQSEALGPYDMDTLTADALELIEKMCQKPVHFAGLSMGGFVGMRLAARHPKWIKTLILLETSANAEPIENLPKYKTLNSVVKLFGVISPVARKVMPILFAQSWLDDPMNDEKKKYWRNEIKANRKSVTGAVEGVIYRKGIESELKDISCPTIIIAGDEDVATKPEKSKYIQMELKNAILRIIPGAGHSSSIEKPKEINRLIGDWLVNQN